jgi:hypothetical protein
MESSIEVTCTWMVPILTIWSWMVEPLGTFAGAAVPAAMVPPFDTPPFDAAGTGPKAWAAGAAVAAGA